MSSHLLIQAGDRAAVLLAALTFATAAKALASVLRTWIEQAFRTRRLIKSLEDAKPHQRPEIIMACGQLERRSAGRPDSDEAGGAFPADEHRKAPVLVLPNKRGYERQGD